MSLIPYIDDSYVYTNPPRFSYPVTYFDDLLYEPWIPSWYTPNWPKPIVEDLRILGRDSTLDESKFQADIDVNQFKPEEISVKVTPDNTVTVEGKHEEKRDEHGYVSRHFVRKYVLPENCNVDNIQTRLSSDGVLTITAPTKGHESELAIEGNKDVKEIPIIQTGRTHRWLDKIKSIFKRS